MLYPLSYEGLDICRAGMCADSARLHNQLGMVEVLQAPGDPGSGRRLRGIGSVDVRSDLFWDPLVEGCRHEGI